MMRATHTILLGLAIALSACDGGGGGVKASEPEGTRREALAHWNSINGRDPIVRMRVWEEVVDGKWVKQGEFVFYDTVGREIASGTYENGLEHGPWVQTEEDGDRGHGRFVQGKRDGGWTYYYRNGAVQEAGAYVDGRKHGQWLRYFENGDPRAELMYREGELHGECRFYEEDGSVDSLLTGRYAYGSRVP